jgi:hypothetical protein
MRNSKFEIRKNEKSNVINLKPKIGRNDPCYCGSGKKYKNCCMKRDQEEERIEELLQQCETVSDKYFTVKEYIELSGYPLTKFDFFLLEILNITCSILHEYNKISNDETKKIAREMWIYSKKFYKKCLTCKYNCLKDPLKNISFKFLIDSGYDISEFPLELQKKIAMNFFYIEFINGFASKLRQELCKEIDEEIADEISTTLYWTLIDYVSDNCSEQCGNECIMEHKENAYCNFCTFGSKKLPCPKEGEISYELIKAVEEDMEH